MCTFERSIWRPLGSSWPSLCGVTCPLTVWEQHLRDLAGQVSYRGDFIATWVHDLMFFDAEPWVFTLCYCSFGAVVALSWLLVPPRFRREKHAPTG